MLNEYILFKVGEGIAQITLNRPERLNAFNTQMLEELYQALDEAAKDDRVLVIVLTGSGRGFCAGQDLTDRKFPEKDQQQNLGESIDITYNPLVRKLRSLKKPIVCSVNGIAAGAGVGLALACDVVIAARSASFIQAFIRIGLAPDCGNSYFLPRLVGEARARALTLTGDKIDAQKAEKWGMIWQTVNDAELEKRTHELALNLAAKPARALTEIKNLLLHSLDHNLDDQLDRERDTQQLLGQNEDYKEGVRAFLEKRSPQFNSN